MHVRRYTEIESEYWDVILDSVIWIILCFLSVICSTELIQCDVDWFELLFSFIFSCYALLRFWWWRMNRYEHEWICLWVLSTFRSFFPTGRSAIMMNAWCNMMKGYVFWSRLDMEIKMMNLWCPYPPLYYRKLVLTYLPRTYLVRPHPLYGCCRTR